MCVLVRTRLCAQRRGQRRMGTATPTQKKIGYISYARLIHSKTIFPDPSTTKSSWMVVVSLGFGLIKTYFVGSMLRTRLS